MRSSRQVSRTPSGGLPKSWEARRRLAGWISSEFAVEDKAPNRIVGIIRFKDKDSYVKNANTPQTNDNYDQMMKFLEGPRNGSTSTM